MNADETPMVNLLMNKYFEKRGLCKVLLEN
jgi:hypothetical protein